MSFFILYGFVKRNYKVLGSLIILLLLVNVILIIICAVIIDFSPSLICVGITYTSSLSPGTGYKIAGDN